MPESPNNRFPSHTLGAYVCAACGSETEPDGARYTVAGKYTLCSYCAEVRSLYNFYDLCRRVHSEDLLAVFPSWKEVT